MWEVTAHLRFASIPPPVTITHTIQLLMMYGGTSPQPESLG